MPDIDRDSPGATLLLMGNEAIARGALEAGVGFVSSYPGTPSSEIVPAIVDVAESRGIYAEWSTNETIAMEAAAGASLAGVRALAAMKQHGVSLVADFLAFLSIGTGQMRPIQGGLVLVSCDDPGPNNSGNEQDSRPIAKWFDFPLLEPGNLQEAKDMTRWLFELSEDIGNICMLRCVSKIAHTRGNVQLGDLPSKTPTARFDTSNPPAVANMHAAAHKRLEKAREQFESSPFNTYVGPEKPEWLIITCGACSLYSREAVKTLNLEDRVGILKIGTIWPLPEKFVGEHLSRSEKILFVEEVDPFLEEAVMVLSASRPAGSPRPVFYGKCSGHISSYGELNPNSVIRALNTLLGLSYQTRDGAYDSKALEASKNLTFLRSGNICPGCPHKASAWAIKQAIEEDGRNGFVTSDIGCYHWGLAGSSVAKTIYCMGSGAGVATGLGKLGQFGFDQPVLAAAGDSTFFHASIPGLINGVYNESNFLLCVFDNSATAMTGFQPHPGTGTNAMGKPAPVVSIEALCRSLNVRVEVCDPFDLETTKNTLVEMMAMKGGARVIILKRECELTRARREGRARYKVFVDPHLCLGEACVYDNVCRELRCSGLLWDEDKGEARIDEVICAGCGVCSDVCPQGAIVKEALT